MENAKVMSMDEFIEYAQQLVQEELLDREVNRGMGRKLQDRLCFDDVRVAEGIEIRDLSDEARREYHYANGDLVLKDPVALRLSDSGSHYVVLATGETMYIPPGWYALSWVAREDANHISF